MELTIRPAQVGDYDRLNVLFEAVDAIHREALPHIFQETGGPPRDWEFVRELLESPECGFFVAVVEAGVIAFVTVLLERSPDVALFRPRCFATIDNLVVAKAFRRRGVGRALIKYAEDWARQQGAAEIELTVYAFNQDAQAVYEGLGYQVVRRRMAKRLN